MKRISYSSGVDSKKSLQLDYADIQLLLYVYQQRRLSQLQAYEFYSLFKEMEIKGFRKRMTKFEEYGLINRLKRSFVKSDGAYLYIVHIGRKGASLLQKLGLLHYKVEDKLSKYKAGNIDHALVTQQVVFNLISQYPGAVKLGYNDNHYFVFDRKEKEDGGKKA